MTQTKQAASQMVEKTHQWAGASGNTYIYTVYPVNVDLGDTEANYIFARWQPAGQDMGAHWVPVYVGEGQMSEHVRSAHHRRDCIKREGATHLHVHETSDPLARMAEEQDLMNMWTPPCNQED